MSLTNKIRRITFALRQTKQFYKYGGISKVIIATPLYDKILENKCVLITGGSSGIGYAIAKRCLETGANVIITGRNEAKLKQAKIELNSSKCHYLTWDISEIDNIKQKLTLCNEMFGKILDVVVNNAGVVPSKFFKNTDEEEWNRIYNNNLKGTFFLSQEIVRQWKAAPFDGYKKIINISSQGGFVGATYPYRMAKWDLRGLTEGLGKMLIGDNIIVNGIAPGVVKTSMQSFSLLQGDNLYTNQNPIKRVILPEEIAELALFLISNSSNAIVGQTIICDGGYTLK